MTQIQFITHATDRFGYVDGARMALEGGCRWVQLRMKGATDAEVLAAAAEIQPLCRQHEALFVIDDRVHLAKQIKADGVHLGKTTCLSTRPGECSARSSSSVERQTHSKT